MLFTIILENWSQSNFLFFGSNNLATSMEPRLQASKGNNGTSPQGFVDIISPIEGVGLPALIVSRKTNPGSPLCHAQCIILFQSCRAGIVLITLAVFGCFN